MGLIRNIHVVSLVLALGAASFPFQLTGAPTTAVVGKIGIQYGCMAGWGLGLSHQSSNWFSFDGTLIYSGGDATSVLNSGRLPNADNTKLKQVDVTTATAHRTMFHGVTRLHPFAGSFNIGLGVGAFQMQADYVGSTLDGSSTLKEHYTFQTLTHSVTVGNTWRTQSYFYAIDWIGWFAGGKTIEKKTSSQEGIDAPGLRQSADAFRTIIDKCAHGGPILFIFTIGKYL